MAAYRVVRTTLIGRVEPGARSRESAPSQDALTHADNAYVRKVGSIGSVAPSANIEEIPATAAFVERLSANPEPDSAWTHAASGARTRAHLSR